MLLPLKNDMSESIPALPQLCAPPASTELTEAPGGGVDEAGSHGDKKIAERKEVTRGSAQRRMSPHPYERGWKSRADLQPRDSSGVYI